MDCTDLVARENEYKKLNKQLEKKTESLMKEIEHVMQKQDFFSEISQNISLNLPPTNVKKHCCSPKTSQNNTPTRKKSVTQIKNTKSSVDENKELNIVNSTDKEECKSYGQVNCSVNNVCMDYEFLQAFVNVNIQDKVLPVSFSKDKITVENVCKFMASKVKLMQEQINNLQLTIDKKAGQCEKHLSLTADLESERMALLNRANRLRAEALEARASCAALQNRLDEKDRLYKEQRSQADKLQCEVKRLRGDGACAEARLAAQRQRADALAQRLHAAEAAEKELRAASRELATSHESAICRLTARVRCLTSRVDKQAALVHNLKKQNALRAADAAVGALERDYCNFLNKDF